MGLIHTFRWAPLNICLTVSLFNPNMAMPRRRLGRGLVAAIVGVIVMQAVWSLLQTEAHCRYECELQDFQQPLDPSDPVFLHYIRTHVLDPPHEPPNPLSREEVTNPSWKDIGSWRNVMDILLPITQGLGVGNYVEVGSGDGEFLSFTSQLEVLFGWQGLLIEPRRSAYLQGRERRRAAGANVCAALSERHSKEQLWEPINVGASSLVEKIIGSRSSLRQFISKEDRADGVLTPVQCLTLESLLLIFLPRSHLDLLVVDLPTAGWRVLETLRTVTIEVFLVRLQEGEIIDAMAMAQLLNMRFVPQNKTTEFGLFVHNRIEFVYRVSDQNHKPISKAAH